jgi:LysM repeat protein
MRRRLAFLLAGALVVAACGGGATPTPAPLSSPTPAPTDIFAQSPAPSVVASPAPAAEPGTSAGGTTYKVKPGDIMISIAKKFGITVAALKKANPTVDPTKMQVGSELIIPPK